MSVAKMDSSLPPPPFLTKTFDMVDDSHTDSIVSWSPSSNIGFVVWDFYEFSGGLLPQFFKHSNFSSFVRQLNTYGFRKADPDRWEFSHEEFRKGQRHRLKNIHRKRPVVSSNSMAMVPTGHPLAHVGVSLSQTWEGVGSYQALPGGDSEIEQLKSETVEITLELGRLSSKNQAVHQQMKYMSNRLQVLEMRQKQIVAFIAQTLCAPNVLCQYVHQAIAADRIRTRLKPLGEACDLADANSIEARKRPRILNTDAHHCRIESGTSTSYNNRLLHLEPQSRKGQAASCETTRDTGMWITTGTDDNNEASTSYDQKPMRDRMEYGNEICAHNQVEEGDHASAMSLYQNAGWSHAVEGSASSPSTNVVGDAEIATNTCMNQPAMQERGNGSARMEDHLETTVDLNWQPFTLTDSLFCSGGTRVGTGETQGRPNNYCQDLESELFWEKLLSPGTSRGDCSRNSSECALAECFGLMNEQEALFSCDYK